MQRRVERAFRRLLASDLPDPCADLLEGERIVADEADVLLDERERTLGGLAVALDRRPLPPALGAVVPDRDVDDVRPVLRLPADHERLRKVEANDLGADVHGAQT